AAACCRSGTRRGSSLRTAPTPRESPPSTTSSPRSSSHDFPRPLLAEPRPALRLRRTHDAPRPARLRQGRQVVPHLVRRRAHHPDGRAHLDLLRARGGPSLHRDAGDLLDRKSTRLNSSHVAISYAVFCLKKKIS